jgi:DNA repair exonuclease SbcCD ATPase subunit
MKPTRLFRLTLAVCCSALSLDAHTHLESTRDVLDQWVQTKQIISKEHNDWHLEQSILADTLTLLNNQHQRLEATLKELQNSATTVDQERSTLIEQREANQHASRIVEDSIHELETQIKRIVAILPTPLIKNIQPLIRRLPI